MRCVISKVEDTFAARQPRGFVYFLDLACDRVRQKRCLEVVSADGCRYDDEVESQTSTASREKL